MKALSSALSITKKAKTEAKLSLLTRRLGSGKSRNCLKMHSSTVTKPQSPSCAGVRTVVLSALDLLWFLIRNWFKTRRQISDCMAPAPCLEAPGFVFVEGSLGEAFKLLQLTFHHQLDLLIKYTVAVLLLPDLLQEIDMICRASCKQNLQLLFNNLSLQNTSSQPWQGFSHNCM